MRDLTNFLSSNGMMWVMILSSAKWVMIIAVVGIVCWFRNRKSELQAHQELRTREMAHLQKMKELDIELEKTKGRSSTGQAA